LGKIFELWSKGQFDLKARENLPKGWVLHDGKFRVGGKIIVPTKLREKVIQAVHSSAHPGVEKTYELLDRKFVFDGLATKDSLMKIIKQYVSACQVCQVGKARSGVSPDDFNLYPLPEYPFASVACDLLELGPSKSHVQGNKYDSVVVIVCRSTGYIIGIPVLKKGLDSAKFAELFLERVVFWTGIPNEFFSDNASWLNSKFLQTLLALSGVERNTSVVYQHRSNGRAEAAVRAIVRALRLFLEHRAKSSGEWYHALPLALWGLNDLPGVVSPYSPHRLLFGRDPNRVCRLPPTHARYFS